MEEEIKIVEAEATEEVAEVEAPAEEVVEAEEAKEEVVEEEAAE